MDFLKTVLITLILTTASSAGTIFVVEGPVEIVEIDLDALFAPENQSNFVSPEGYICFGPDDRISYSVWEDYSFGERQRIWQECQKWLVGIDPETLLYVYQYIAQPDPFPLDGYPLAIEQPSPVDVPPSLLLGSMGVALILRRRVHV